jgi:hypothetical protein
MTAGTVVVVLALLLPLAGAIVAQVDCCDDDCCTSSTLRHCACLNVAIVRDSYVPTIISCLVFNLVAVGSIPPVSLCPESPDQPPRHSA